MWEVMGNYHFFPEGMPRLQPYISAGVGGLTAIVGDVFGNNGENAESFNDLFRPEAQARQTARLGPKRIDDGDTCSPSGMAAASRVFAFGVPWASWGRSVAARFPTSSVTTLRGWKPAAVSPLRLANNAKGSQQAGAAWAAPARTAVPFPVN